MDIEKAKELNLNNLYEELRKLWDEYYGKGYEKMSLTIPSQKVAGGMIEALIPCPGGVVLDGGCGTGLYFKDILDKTQAAQLIGGDYSKGMLEGAEKNLGKLPETYKKAIKLVNFDLSQKFPFGDNFFDAEIFHLSISYLPYKDWRHALEEAYRTLKPGGYVYVTTQLREFDFSKVYKKEVLKSIITTPSLFVWILKVRKVISALHKLAEEGIIVYPEERELLEAHGKVGFSDVKIAKRIYEGTVITVARRPSM